MKRFKNMFVLFAFLALGACNYDKNIPPQSSGSIEVEVGAVASDLNAAMINPTEEILDEITADMLTYGHSSGMLQDKKEFINDLLHGPFSFKTIDISEQTIQISGDVAIVRHILDSEGIDSGTPVHVHIGIVLVFQNQSGQWKLLARQAYKL